MNQGFEELPFAQDFYASLDLSNEWIAPRRVRRYQREIIEKGTFSIVSPSTGRPVTAVTSAWIMPGQYIAYRFEFDFPAWIVVGEIKDGYPLQSLLRAEDQAAIGLFQFSGSRIGSTGVANLSFAEIEKKFAPLDREHDAKPIIVIGHPNFAHHLWNELSAILEITQSIPDETLRRASVLSIFEPLGPLAELIDRKDVPLSIQSISPAEVETSRRGGLLTRLGSTIVTNAARQRAIEYAIRASDNGDVRNISTTPFDKVFWISVRNEVRTCVNQVEFLSELVVRLFSEFPCCAVVFDGFSFPEDCNFASRYSGWNEIFGRRASESIAIISKIIKAVVDSGTQNAAERMTTLSGCKLHHSIMVGQYIDYYICHAGTTQHKIGWLHNKPGFVHSSSASITRASANWFSAQVEDGLPVDCISPLFVEDISDPTVFPARNWNYRILDVKAASQAVINCIRQRLS